MSTVSKITAAVQAAVAGISSANNFLTAAVVTENFPPALADDLASPVVIGVFLVGLQIDESEVKSLAGKQTFDSPTHVMVQIKAIIRTSTDKAEGDKQNLVADLQAAIFADRSLGVGATNGTVTVETITFQNFGYSQAATGVLVDFDAVVRVDCLTNPSAP